MSVKKDVGSVIIFKALLTRKPGLIEVKKLALAHNAAELNVTKTPIAAASSGIANFWIRQKRWIPTDLF